MVVRPAFCILLSLIAGNTNASAQNAKDILNMFGGIMQSAITQAAQTEWKKLPQNELTCVDQALRRRGSDLGTAIQQGITPSDPRVADVRAACRPSAVQAPAPSSPVTANQPPQPQELLWDHNGSTAYLIARGRSRKFFYKEPRPGMASAGAQSGSMIFDGEIIGNDQYQGTAYLFNSRCGQLPYRVNGLILDQPRRVELRGQAPRVDNNCRVIGYFEDTLAFQLIEPKVATPFDTPAAAATRNADDSVNRRIIEAETARRSAEETARRTHAEADAAKRAAEEADQKAQDYKRQIEQQQNTQNIILICLAVFVGLLISAGIVLAIRPRKRKSNISSESVRGAENQTTIEEGISEVVTAITAKGPIAVPADEQRDIESTTRNVVDSKAIAKKEKAVATKAARDGAAVSDATAKTRPPSPILSNETMSRSSNDDVIDELVKFSELRATGVLTEDEFSELKKNLIGLSSSKPMSSDDYIKQLRLLRDEGDLTEDEFHSKVLASLSERNPSKAKGAVDALLPGEPLLGSNLTSEDKSWLVTAFNCLDRIYEKRSAFCIFDVGDVYVQFLASPDAKLLVCEAASAKSVPKIAAMLRAEGDEILQRFRFHTSESSPNYSRTIKIESLEDIGYAARLGFRVFKQVYRVADFSSATFKENILK